MTECSICWDIITDKKVLFNCCNERFYHLNCAYTWMSINSTCPFCRKQYFVTESNRNVHTTLNIDNSQTINNNNNQIVYNDVNSVQILLCLFTLVLICFGIITVFIVKEKVIF